MNKPGLGVLLAWVFVVFAGCATDPRVASWRLQWLAAERTVVDTHGQEGLEALEAARQAAITPMDRDIVAMSQAHAMALRGEYRDAFLAYHALYRSALKRTTRAHAFYEMANIAYDTGRLVEATRIYRKVVYAYPNLVPAMRSLHNLEELADKRGAQAQLEHLEWCRKAYTLLDNTMVGDDLIFQAANTAYRWWRYKPAKGLGTLAEYLLLEVAERHPGTGHWGDAMWALSHLYRRQGRVEDEVRTLRTLVDTHSKPILESSYGGKHHWVGVLRIARLEMMMLEQPALAGETFDLFVTTFETNSWRDDAKFWAGCAYLRAGMVEEAEEAFAEIAEIYDESKYLRRVAKAREEPMGRVCEPKDFEEDTW